MKMNELDGQALAILGACLGIALGFAIAGDLSMAGAISAGAVIGVWSSNHQG